MRECETKIFIWGCGLNPSLYGKAKHVTHILTAKNYHNAALALHVKVLFFLLYNDDMVPFRPLFPPIITTNWEDLKVGGGAQGPVSQNCTSNPSNSSRVIELSRI
jgi:hypothetical protein